MLRRLPGGRLPPRDPPGLCRKCSQVHWEAKARPCGRPLAGQPVCSRGRWAHAPSRSHSQRSGRLSEEGPSGASSRSRMALGPWWGRAVAAGRSWGGTSRGEAAGEVCPGGRLPLQKRLVASASGEREAGTSTPERGRFRSLSETREQWRTRVGLQFLFGDMPLSSPPARTPQAFGEGQRSEVRGLDQSGQQEAAGPPQGALAWLSVTARASVTLTSLAPGPLTHAASTAAR